MKLSFIFKVRALLLFLFAIMLMQGIGVIIAVSTVDLPPKVTLGLHNIIYITTFLSFFFSMLLFFYLPLFMKKSVDGIHKLLKEISKGNYSLEIDWRDLKESVDKEFSDIIVSIDEMLVRIKSFDELKKTKILELRSRLRTLMNLSENGFMIVNPNGEIIYINDPAIDNFDGLDENVNIATNNFVPDVENSVKKYTVATLKAKSRQEPQQFYIPALKRHITLKSGIVRNQAGKPMGVVIGILNLDRRRPEAKEKEKDEN